MLCSGLVGDIQQATIWVPKIVVERVVHDHADETPHHDRRIDFRKSPVTLPLADVAAQKLIDGTHILVEEHLCELVLFECRVKQQTLKLWILLVKVESRESERLEDGAVVFAIDRFRSQLSRVKAIVRASFVIDDGGVKLFLGGEVPEDHGL